MADESRLFFKLHSGFTEHPKTVGLSDKAFRHLIELWLYCHRNMTDGAVPSGQILRALTKKTKKELTDAGYLIVGENGAEMHDYLRHQMSADSIETLRNKRKLAGAAGGKARAEALASAKAKAEAEAKQKRTKPVADKDEDKDAKESAPKKTGAGQTPEHQATDLAYALTGKAFDFIKVRGIAKWAIHDRGETIQSVSDALVGVYRADKPITKSTVGQYLDGIAKQSPRKQAAKPNPLWD